MEIAVIGCGVGGMAAAIALSRQGHDVVVFERFDEPRPLGAGLLLQPTGLAALRALGLEDEVRALGAEAPRLEGRTRAGRPVLDLPYRGPCGLGVHRGALFHALYSGVTDAEVRVVTNARVTGVSGLEGDRVTLTFDEDADHTCDAVIIADGAHSGLRDALAPTATAPEYAWGALWGVRPDPDGRWLGALRQVYDGARVMIGVMPVGRDPAAPETPHNVAFFWSLKTADLAAARTAGIAPLRAEVSSIWPQAGALLGDVERIDALFDARYRDVRLARPARGRALFIGDAAHGTSPQLGQGANLALIDAMQVAHDLGPAAQRVHPARAFTAYASARARHVNYYRFMSRLLTPFFQSDSRVLGGLRDAVFVWLCRAPGFGALMRATLSGRAQWRPWPWRGPWERSGERSGEQPGERSP